MSATFAAMLSVALLGIQNRPPAISVDDSNRRTGEATNELRRDVRCKHGPSFNVTVRDGKVVSLRRGTTDLPDVINQARAAFGNVGVVSAEIACHEKGSFLLLTGMRSQTLASLFLPNA